MLPGASQQNPQGEDPLVIAQAPPQPQARTIEVRDWKTPTIFKPTPHFPLPVPVEYIKELPSAVADRDLPFRLLQPNHPVEDEHLYWTFHYIENFMYLTPVAMFTGWLMGKYTQLMFKLKYPSDRGPPSHVPLYFFSSRQAFLDSPFGKEYSPRVDGKYSLPNILSSIRFFTPTNLFRGSVERYNLKKKWKRRFFYRYAHIMYKTPMPHLKFGMMFTATHELLFYFNSPRNEKGEKVWQPHIYNEIGATLVPCLYYAYRFRGRSLAKNIRSFMSFGLILPVIATGISLGRLALPEFLKYRMDPYGDKVVDGGAVVDVSKYREAADYVGKSDITAIGNFFQSLRSSQPFLSAGPPGQDELQAQQDDD